MAAAVRETLEERGRRDRCVWVPVAVELAEHLSQEEDGPLWVRIEPDPGGDPTVRAMVFRTEAVA